MFGDLFAAPLLFILSITRHSCLALRLSILRGCTTNAPIFHRFTRADMQTWELTFFGKKRTKCHRQYANKQQNDCNQKRVKYRLHILSIN